MIIITSKDGGKTKDVYSLDIHSMAFDQKTQTLNFIYWDRTMYCTHRIKINELLEIKDAYGDDSVIIEAEGVILNFVKNENAPYQLKTSKLI